MKIGQQYKETLQIFKKVREIKKTDSEISDKEALVQAIREVKQDK